MEAQNDFFTLQSLATFAGTTGATTVMANGVQRAFNYNPAWLALAIAEFLCIGVVFFTHNAAPEGVSPPISDYFVALVNGFLVFASSAGLTASGNAVVNGPAAPGGPLARGRVGGPVPGGQARKFWSPWL